MNLKENDIKIRQWFQPYYKPRPDGYVEPELDEVNSEDGQSESFQSVNGDKALKVKVLTNKNPLTQVVNSKHKPKCLLDLNRVKVLLTRSVTMPLVRS